MTHLTLLQNDDIKGLIHHLGANEISRVLLRCQSDSVSALTFFNWVKNDLGLKPSTRNYCLILHVLAWSKEYEQAMKFLIELILLGKDPDEDVFQCLFLCCQDCNWDPIIFDLLLKAYVKVDMIKEGLRTFMQILEVGYVPSVIACNYLLNGNEGWLISALNLVVELEKFGVSISPDIYNYLIASLCEEDRPFAAKTLLERMSQRGYIPRVEIYNKLIESLCKSDCVADALTLKAEIVAGKTNPNLLTYKALIRCLCRMGRSMEAEKLMEEMLHFGLQPDQETCRAMIHGYCREKDAGRAESLLVLFAKEFHIFDSESYSTVVRIVCEDGDVAKFMELQEQMLKVGFAPNSLTCKYMIDGLRKNVGL
ncbi:hypothetical protein OIU76_028375, partial [Salix suchowensis]